MKNKKIIWKILLVIGFIPFALALIYGIYSAITGFSGLCFCCKYYGFKAFFDGVILLSYLIFPFYIVGIGLVILSIIKLRRKK